MAIHCNQLECRQIHFTRHFSHAHCTRLTMCITPHGSSVCMRASPHPHAIHDERLSVCSSLFLRSDSLRESLLHLALLFPFPLVLCPELLLPCGQHQGNHSLRLRQLRSLALWQNTLLPQSTGPPLSCHVGWSSCCWGSVGSLVMFIVVSVSSFMVWWFTVGMRLFGCGVIGWGRTLWCIRKGGSGLTLFSLLLFCSVIFSSLLVVLEFWVIRAGLMRNSVKLGFPTFAVLGKGIPALRNLLKRLMGGYRFCWRRADGSRVECFPRIHHIAAHQQSPRVHDQNGRPITIQRTNDLHVDVQWPPLGVWRQWTGMHCQRHTCDFICKKISSRTMVFPRTWIRKEVVLCLHWQTTRRMGQSCRPDDVKLKFGESKHPVFRSTSPLSRGNAQKQRRWKIIDTLLCRWGWNCFSHNYFC